MLTMIMMMMFSRLRSVSDIGQDASSSKANIVVGDFHLIVMQHGFQGNAFDMALLRNALVTHLPDYTHVGS